jgi:5-methylcytosine-specific restriction endonuclease McrA
MQPIQPKTDEEEFDEYLKEVRQKTYKMYLRSDKWHEFRIEALRYYFNRCCFCGNTEKLNVHHINYDNLYKEELKDVTVLCWKCHSRHHRAVKEVLKRMK